MKRFEGKPFTILGVNSDITREKVKEVVAKKKITWRWFWDGGSAQGPIQCRWNITAWPTMYLIDHEGRIIERIGLGKKTEELIEQKVKEAETAAAK